MTDKNGKRLSSGDWVNYYGKLYQIECISNGVVYIQKIIFNGDGSYGLDYNNEIGITQSSELIKEED